MRLPEVDVLRTAILGVANAIFPTMQLFGIVDWSGEQVAAVMLSISTTLTLLFLFYPSGSEPR